VLRSIVDMFKALALYPMPSDPQAFRDHYESIHLPLVAKLPGVRSLRYSFDLNAPLGEAPFFAVFEVEWDDSSRFGRFQGFGGSRSDSFRGVWPV
jgi:uncharacterized protein (TIGR02118 family)